MLLMLLNDILAKVPARCWQWKCSCCELVAARVAALMQCS